MGGQRGSSNATTTSSSSSGGMYTVERSEEEEEEEEEAGNRQSRSKLILEAYKEKMAALDSIRINKERSKRKIKMNTPIRKIDRNKIYKVNDHWWEKKPSIAGEGMNSSQARLSDVDNFSPVVRDRVLRKVNDGNNFGEYCHDPLKARRLLMNLSYSDLTIPGRAADFRTGVEWRLMLRPSLPR